MLIFEGCKSPIPPLTDDDFKYANALFTISDTTYLIEGRKLFIRNCGKCHYLRNPLSRTPEQWNQILMEHQYDVKLPPHDFQKIKVYLLTVSRNAKK